MVASSLCPADLGLGRAGVTGCWPMVAMVGQDIDEGEDLLVWLIFATMGSCDAKKKLKIQCESTCSFCPTMNWSIPFAPENTTVKPINSSIFLRVSLSKTN